MSIQRQLRRWAMATLMLAATATAMAQIIIEPIMPVPTKHRPWPPFSPRPEPFAPVQARALNVDAQARDQVLQVRLSQTFHNPNPRAMEAQYYFPVPDGCTVQNFTLLVDGKELTGELMDKDQARGIYESIVRRMRDPGLLEWAGRGLLRTSVFPIPPDGDRTVELRYTALLPRESGRMEIRLPLTAPGSLAGKIGKLSVQARLESTEAIKTLYSPTDGVKIDRDGDRRATARLELTDSPAPSDFRLVAGVAEGEIGATLLSTHPNAKEDGAFLLLVSPAMEAGPAKPMPKTVVCVLDRSGSMSGQKIEQARGALKFVLGNLGPDDAFNIVAYDDQVETFKPELQGYSAKTRDAALAFVDNIRPGGSTDIDAALKAALAMLPEDPKRPAYVIFLTDGLPTAGQTDEMTIDGDVRKANGAAARVFAFGVGDDVNARLLDRLSGDNRGATEYVHPSDDIEGAVSRFYGKIASPVLGDLKLELTGVTVNRQEPARLTDLFRGEQLAVAGRYVKGGKTTIRLSGTVGGKQKTFEFPARLAEASEGQDNAFVERLWATRRIGELIDRIDLEGRNQELIDELVGLSKRYGILTPYTSFLAREDTDLAANADQRRMTGDNLQALGSVSGSGGVAQRAYKAQMSKAMTAPASPALAAANATRSPSGGPAYEAFALSSSAVQQANAPASAPGFAGGVAGGQAQEPESDVAKAGETMRQIGAKTFYKRAGGWIDSEAIGKPATAAIKIVAYTDAWFELSRKLGPGGAAWLAFQEPVTLWIDGKLYRVEPEPAATATPPASPTMK
jgi:Ca-activated chloride channel family protein